MVRSCVLLTFMLVTGAAGVSSVEDQSLFDAAYDGRVNAIDELLAAGADVNQARTTDGVTPLYFAAYKGHLTVVTKLVAAGADIDKAMTTSGGTPLYIAAQQGHIAIVSKLLQHGADKSIRGFQNMTPLEQAQRMNRAAVVALLA